MITVMTDDRLDSKSRLEKQLAMNGSVPMRYGTSLLVVQQCDRPTALSVNTSYLSLVVNRSA